MRVLFWVQHLLGTGHLRRAVTLAGAMADRGLDVTLASGGPPAPWSLPEGVELVQLPPLAAGDERFSVLLDQHGRAAGERLWAQRRALLLALLEQLRPRVVMTEMFPFGRRAFRAELLPVLEAAAATSPGIWRLCSVRDVLVRKPSPERSAWMRDAALAHYHHILVHTDPSLIPFDLTFPHARVLGRRLVYTGYIAPPAAAAPATEAGRGEVLISAGGGRVGQALLQAAIHARARSRVCGQAVWRIVTGPELPEADCARLHTGIPEGVIIERQRPDFLNLLANSLLSVSQAGYNTVVEALRYQTTMVLVPFETATESEQAVRAEALERQGLARIVRMSALGPESLAEAVDAAVCIRPASRHAVDLDGAARSAELVAQLARQSDGPGS